jgi:carbon starvation protein CstA
MEESRAFHRTFPIVLAIAFLGGALLWWLVSRPVGLGFLLGNFTSLFAMSQLYRSSQMLLQLPAEAAKRRAVRNYLIRYLLYATVLLVAALLDPFDLLTTGLSLFLFKLVFYVLLFLENGKEHTPHG